MCPYKVHKAHTIESFSFFCIPYVGIQNSSLKITILFGNSLISCIYVYFT